MGSLASTWPCGSGSAEPAEYEDADWDQYYAEYTRHMTAFLPIAHRLQFPA